MPVQNLAGRNFGPVRSRNGRERVKLPDPGFNAAYPSRGIVHLVQDNVITERNLIGCIGAVGQLVKNKNGVDHTQDRIQPALRPNDLIDHQMSV